MKTKVIKMDLNTIKPLASCGKKGCKVIRLPFTTVPNWDSDPVEYKRA